MILKEGENVIGIILGNGFMNCIGGIVWDFDKVPWRSAPCVAVELLAENNEKSLTIESDTSFKVCESPIVFDDLPPFEDYSMKNRTYKFFEGIPIYPFGYGLNYSEISEEWEDENTVILTNKGEYEVNYTVLKFEYIPHKNLCGFKKQFIKSGESIRVKF